MQLLTVCTQGLLKVSELFCPSAFYLLTIVILSGINPAITATVAVLGAVILLVIIVASVRTYRKIRQRSQVSQPPVPTTTRPRPAPRRTIVSEHEYAYVRHPQARSIISSYLNPDFNAGYGNSLDSGFDSGLDSLQRGDETIGSDIRYQPPDFVSSKPAELTGPAGQQNNSWDADSAYVAIPEIASTVPAQGIYTEEPKFSSGFEDDESQSSMPRHVAPLSPSGVSPTQLGARSMPAGVRSTKPFAHSMTAGVRPTQLVAPSTAIGMMSTQVAHQPLPPLPKVDEEEQHR